MQQRVRHRWGTAVVATTAFALAAGSQGVAVALPEAPPRTDREFSSSFESGDPAPDWLNTVETTRGGGKRASGVNGGYSAGIPGNVTDHVTEVRASAENTDGREVKEHLVDSLSSTKWLAFEPTAWVEFDFDAPVEVQRYALTSANDHDERDPRDWVLKGSADGEDWTTLDTRAGETFEERFQTKTYALEKSVVGEYRHFRLEITKNGSGNMVQLADVQFAAGGEDQPVPEDMLSLVDRGPTGSPTAKARAGFTGVRALRYAGRHLADGRAYSYNKVFDVHVKVERDTQLSYRVFPSMADGDLDYDATNVAVDLAFTDGTYLSDLRATDQHGFPLTPRGQGESKVLYVNQWNNVVSRIGSVARGKTVDRILVAYDSPRARRSSAAGWTTWP